VFYWIYDLPIWLTFLVFAGVFVGLAWVGIIALRPGVRRWFGPQPGQNDMVIMVLTAAGVFYGLLLGLIAAATYQNFSDSDQTVSAEASVLAALYRDASGYPQPLRGQLQADLRAYTSYVIEEAWPAQRRGIVPEGGTARVTVFWNHLLTFQPATPGQQVLYQATMDQFGKFVDVRRQRLQDVTAGLPAVLWWVLAGGALINIMLTWLFSMDKLWAHLILAGLFALFLGLMVFLIAALDHPFRGGLSVGPDAFELVQRSLMRS